MPKPKQKGIRSFLKVQETRDKQCVTVTEDGMKGYVIFVAEVFMHKDGFNIVGPIRKMPNYIRCLTQEKLKLEVNYIQRRELPVSEMKSAMNENNISHHNVSENRSGTM